MGCEGAHLEFPAKLVLDDVTLGVHEGDRIGIVGKNGDGKSTLLGVLAGQIELEGGLVRRTRGLTVGVLGQTDSLSDDATVGYSVVGDAPEYEWASDPRIREIISELIADIDWNAKVGTLSGGQRRRVDLTRLLIGDYDVIMMDEPSLGLAPNIVDDILEVAKTMVKNDGISVLLVEQDITKALAAADRGYVIENGRVALEGTAAELSANEHVKKAYLGI